MNRPLGDSALNRRIPVLRTVGIVDHVLVRRWRTNDYSLISHSTAQNQALSMRVGVSVTQRMRHQIGSHREKRELLAINPQLKVRGAKFILKAKTPISTTMKFPAS